MDIDAKFVPKATIDAYELAIIVGKVQMPSKLYRFTEEQWFGLPQNIRRHFERQGEP